MSFTAETIQKVWEKGFTASGNDPQLFRKDQCGAWIGRNYYGDRESEYGWEIDHIKCIANAGTDILFNLRPLQWQNNAFRQDDRLVVKVQ